MSGKHLTGETRVRTRARAAELYVQGCTIASTARQIGFSYGTTRTLLIEAGVRLRKPGGLRSTSFR
ncbi:helix-turn-helix domain-containing protein [Streptomyces sp. NPDC093591]|uniref:helix-turn-helix domain-containing protein n=1 Tax=Streptomyces sp. NPDC093591 TaxID=3366044 RepID=UPI00382DDC69